MADAHTSIIEAVKKAQKEKRHAVSFVGTMPTKTENELKRLNYKINSIFEECECHTNRLHERYTISWTPTIVMV